ncbi:uncharacterized protein G2W53_040977 [Senna tora]|uniref:Uncharacterized protein n=1 Tax=Senna tora TaxID=362788 RepID=A0A834SEZ9_9FABA|nr:uncharacterized protein G2W53_040977 [Senna tora]
MGGTCGKTKFKKRSSNQENINTLIDLAKIANNAIKSKKQFIMTPQ